MNLKWVLHDSKGDLQDKNWGNENRTINYPMLANNIDKYNFK